MQPAVRFHYVYNAAVIPGQNRTQRLRNAVLEPAVRRRRRSIVSHYAMRITLSKRKAV